MTLHLTAVAAKDGNGTAIPGGIQQNDSSGTGAGPNDPAIILIDSTGAEILGTTADAAVSAGAAGTLSGKFRQMSAALGSLVAGTVLAAGAAIIGKVSAVDSAGVDATDTTNHAFRVNVVAGGASGGTSSTVGSAVPGTATAIGFSDGTNLKLGVIKAASTAPVATDPAIVVALSPNGLLAPGQGAMAASAPVVIASDQSALTTQTAAAANIVSGVISSAMTGTTSTSLVAAPGASLRNYITTFVVSNSHATVGTDILIQDGTGGTTLAVIPAAAAYGGAVITLPTPLRQPTANTALFAQNVTTGSSTKVSAFGFKAA